MLASITTPVTWSSGHTVMCPISQPPRATPVLLATTSCAAGYYFLSSRPLAAPTATDPTLPDNGPLHVLSQIMQQVVASTAEAELGALFLNAHF